MTTTLGTGWKHHPQRSNVSISYYKWVYSKPALGIHQDPEQPQEYDPVESVDYGDPYPAEELPRASEDGVTIVQNDPEAILDHSEFYIRRHPYAKEKPIYPGPVQSSHSGYWPFNTRQDFEQVEIFYKADSTNPTMDDQLRLNMRNQGGRDGPYTLRNAKDVHKTLKKAFSFPEEKVSVVLHVSSRDPPRLCSSNLNKFQQCSMERSTNIHSTIATFCRQYAMLLPTQHLPTYLLSTRKDYG
jgi:hypothetical protein